MRRLLYPFLFISVTIGAGCAGTAESGPVVELSASALAARQSIDAVGKAIDEYRLQDAYDRARELRSWVELHRDSLPDTLRARLYQYLSELHTKRSLHFDSVNYYTRAAEALVPEHAPVLLRARQLYVKAMGRTAYDRTWVDVMMTADLGLQLLERNGLTSDPLYAKLLVARGIGGKKYADDLTDSAEMRQIWRESAASIEEGIAKFARISPKWERFAWTELAFLWMRLEEPEAVFRQLVDTIGSLDQRQPSPDSLYVLAYYHFYGNRPAAAYPVAEALGNAGPHFGYNFLSGADYIRYQSALQLGQYDRAVVDSKLSARHFGCCPLESILAAETSCGSPRGCANYLTGQASIRLQRYHAEGRQTDLDTAYLISQWALGQYELNFRNEQEESALNVMRVIGQRMLNASVEAAYDMTVSDTAADRYNALLRTMERGKALLLDLDLREGLADASGARIVRELRERRTEIQQLKGRYLREGGLPLADLVTYQQISGQYEQLSAGLAPVADVALTRYANGDRSVATVGEIRDALGHRRALLELAETGTSVIGLYVDSDTVISYRADLHLLDSLASRFTSMLRGSVVQGADTVGYYAPAHALYRTLLGPIGERVRKREELLVAGSALLQDLPLSALMDGPDRYLLDRLLIRYIPSWRVEQQHDKLRGRFAGSDAPRVSVWTYPQLTNYFSRINDLLDERGRSSFHRPSAKLSEATGADILHLSVHARGNPARLHDNYLYFSREDSLNGVAIGQQPLGARLVVLAACSTARGFASPGEGTFSLQRSFHVAGVPDVVSSVYEIPAGATAALLEVFYRELFAGAEPAVALHRARLSLRAGGGRYSVVGYWGGMVVG